MPNVDIFESVFNSAIKESYTYARAEFKNIAIVTDMAMEQAQEVTARTEAFLGVLGDDVNWIPITGGQSATVQQLLGLIETHNLDMVCTWRNLHSKAWQWPHSLGRHLDVLTQATPCPVLVIPHPQSGVSYDAAMKDTSEVMAMTDHLTGDDRLVNIAARLTQKQGKLFLTHVEDETVFERFIDAISKIPEIDTDQARILIHKQLLKEPHDFIQLCARVLKEQDLSITIEEIVSTGHHLDEYERLIRSHEVDLLILNTKDHDQLAMHGRSYPLAIELRHTPLLLL